MQIRTRCEVEADNGRCHGDGRGNNGRGISTGFDYGWHSVRSSDDGQWTIVHHLSSIVVQQPPPSVGYCRHVVSARRTWNASTRTSSSDGKIISWPSFPSERPRSLRLLFIAFISIKLAILWLGTATLGDHLTSDNVAIVIAVVVIDSNCWKLQHLLLNSHEAFCNQQLNYWKIR